MKTDVTIYVQGEWDPNHPLSSLTEIASGVLTDEHALATDGEPVLALDDGRVLGPGDVPGDWEIGVAGEDGTDFRVAFDALRALARKIVT